MMKRKGPSTLAEYSIETAHKNKMSAKADTRDNNNIRARFKAYVSAGRLTYLTVPHRLNRVLGEVLGGVRRSPGKLLTTADSRPRRGHVDRQLPIT